MVLPAFLLVPARPDAVHYGEAHFRVISFERFAAILRDHLLACHEIVFRESCAVILVR